MPAARPLHLFVPPKCPHPPAVPHPPTTQEAYGLDASPPHAAAALPAGLAPPLGGPTRAAPSPTRGSARLERGGSDLSMLGALGSLGTLGTLGLEGIEALMAQDQVCCLPPQRAGGRAGAAASLCVGSC